MDKQDSTGIKFDYRLSPVILYFMYQPDLKLNMQCSSNTNTKDNPVILNIHYYYSASTSSSSNRTTSKDWKDLVLLVFAAASAAALLLSARREAKLDQLRLQEQQTFADQEDVPIGSQELTLPELIGHARKPRTFFGKLYDTLLECILIPLRIFELAFRFAPVVFLAPLVFLPSRYYVAGWQQWWWTLLVHTIESCGPTFIKLAQWASSRRDLFPADMCAQLSRLHGRSQPHSFARTAEVIRSALAERNATVEDAFSYIDPQPVGSGCVAQVHRAILKADGSVVALKVLHPGIQRKIERDMLILYACAVTMETLVPPLRWMSLVESVEQFSSLMLRQLDLRIEGANLIKFNRNFANYRGIRFPTVFPEWTSERMLVESYEPGVSLNRFIRANDHPANLHLGELGLRAFLKMMILDNFIHGDLHPGNMLAQMQFPASQLSPEALASSRSLHNVPFNDDTLDTVPQHLHVNVQSATQYAETAEIIEEENPIGVLNDDDPLCFTFSLRPGAKHAYQPYQETYPNGKPTKPKDVQMLLIDAGIVTELSPVDRVNFIDLFTAVARGQGRAVGELMVDRARGQSENLDREGFISSVDNLVTRVRVQTLALGKVRIADILSEMFSLVCMYGVKLESNFVSLAVCIMVLEGIGRCLNPEIDLLDAALPMLEAVEANRGLTAGQLSNTQAGAIRNMARAFSGVRWVVFKGDIELLGQPSIVFHLMD
ncbi:aarF domain containing kinase 2 [Capsaspora owczarzaki ATCC 30864]|uniref:aarF domain containing kinase 2 n=1 Tax=Capsaspora owczarzaki (strain ATCC 30864) TaxID=595528 RepID=UPI0001FE3CF6|nr:aarF domain containing kinase 2 [Capsaspora owczarzaki ATCC 30864]|eukprot:XP_004343153.1 aarF domain containing kinase 2 [Capsaspora owczarzaki ATCC 30864]